MIWNKLAPYAKFVVAVMGAGVTSALALTPSDDPLFKLLTIASSVITALGVYFTPNQSEAAS